MVQPHPLNLIKCAAAALALALGTASAAADTPLDGPPDAAFFTADPGRTWLSHCVYQSDRYVVCKHAARPVIEAISKPGETTPGAALQAHMRQLFEEKGCTFEAPEDTFRVNGIFLSLDAEAAKKIRCGDKSPKLVFAPGVISFLDTLYFLSDGPPQ